MKGLTNAGNLCYFNAMLQCLTYCPNLANYCIADCAHEHANAKRKGASALGLALSAFVRAYWNVANQPVADASEVYAAFTKACRGFANTRQHDAHEAMMLVLEKVHDGLSRLKPGELGVCETSDIQRKPWTDSLKGSCSVVSELFRGQIEKEVVAPGYTSVTYDHFTCLSLEVHNCTSLMKCFQSFMSPTTLTDFKVNDANTEASVTTRFTYLPRILIVHLKRFDDAMTKIDRFVDYPMELNLQHFCKPECPHHYQLFAMCMHRGQCGSGHYTACCEVKGRWHHMDDESVTVMTNINDIIHRDAYVLLYKRL